MNPKPVEQARTRELALPRRRAEQILEIADRNPDVPLRAVMLAARFTATDEEVSAAVRQRLREMADAVDPAVVEPLYRLTQAQVRRRLAPWQISALAAFLRELNAHELNVLRDLLRKILSETDSAGLRLKSWAEGERRIGFNTNDGRIVSPDARSHLFRQFRNSGVGLPDPSASGTFSSVADAGEPLEGVIVERAMVEELLALIS